MRWGGAFRVGDGERGGERARSRVKAMNRWIMRNGNQWNQWNALTLSQSTAQRGNDADSERKLDEKCKKSWRSVVYCKWKRRTTDGCLSLRAGGKPRDVSTRGDIFSRGASLSWWWWWWPPTLNETSRDVARFGMHQNTQNQGGVVLIAKLVLRRPRRRKGGQGAGRHGV